MLHYASDRIITHTPRRVITHTPRKDTFNISAVLLQLCYLYTDVYITHAGAHVHL